MIPAAFDYSRPASLDEALRLIASDGAKVLAGGQSLLPLLKLRLASGRGSWISGVWPSSRESASWPMGAWPSVR